MLKRKSDMHVIISCIIVLLFGLCGSLSQETNFVVDDVNPRLICEHGFRFQENRGCIDVDECLEQAPCQPDQNCRNIYGSFLCVCPYGFHLDNTTGECVDRDECLMGFCGNGQTCINSIGSFSCVCSPGTKKIGRFCRDINECTQQPCDSNQYCRNTRGSYRCTCKQGYTDNGEGKCEDTDECTQEMCQGMGEKCENTIGGYQCVCKEGYTKFGRYCVDVNECDLDQCSDHSECINTQGSFHCRCHKGFSTYNGECVDNQECQLSEGKKCQWRCENRPGSFICQCPQGYNRVDFACNDVNECDDGNGLKICGENRTCVNTHGSHKCIEPITCMDEKYYRKLTTTDEFGYRQVTTNICRRKRCHHFVEEDGSDLHCRQLSLSVSQHYIDITSGLDVGTDLFRINFPARRRRQRYNFRIVKGDEVLFRLRQPSMYSPLAYLLLNQSLTGEATHTIEVDMNTYNRRGDMRDNRKLNIHVYVSPYDF